MTDWKEVAAAWEAKANQAERERDEARRAVRTVVDGGAHEIKRLQAQLAAVPALVEDSHAVTHEFNEALRIIDSWRHRNEDAAEAYRHVVNAREAYHTLVRALAKWEQAQKS